MIKVDVLENGSLLILERTVSDSVKFEKIKFSFPERWKDFVKTAVFRNGETAVEILLNSGSDYCTGKDECFVPFEVIKPPFFTVSVFGSRGDTLATTTRGEIEVVESGYELGDEPQEPTQSVYAQILDETKKATQIAQSVRDDADNGKFKGEKGDKGEVGNGGIVDLAYNSESENAQSGKAVAEAISGIEFSGGGVIEIDQNFDPESENAQSGKAVAEAIKNEIEVDSLIESLKEQNNGENFTFWVGTQAEYDALDEKTDNCLYLITDDKKASEIEAALAQNSVTTTYQQNYYCEKHGDGILKCKGRYSFKGIFDSSYGNAFYSPQISLPLVSIFGSAINDAKEIWGISANISGTNEFLGVNIANYDAENIVFYVFSHKEFTDEKEAVITFDLLGKWK